MWRSVPQIPVLWTPDQDVVDADRRHRHVAQLEAGTGTFESEHGSSVPCLRAWRRATRFLDPKREGFNPAQGASRCHEALVNPFAGTKTGGVLSVGSKIARVALESMLRSGFFA